MTKSSERILAYSFGCVFVAAILLLAVLGPDPTQFQYTVFRIVLALALGGVATMLPGFLQVSLGPGIRAGGALAVFTVACYFTPAQLVVEESVQPKVVLMDSTLPLLVYDPATRKLGGTNADDISEALDDLPINILKETINLGWSRDEEILQLDPELVIIHASGFYNQTDGSDSQQRLSEFLDSMAPSKSQFIVYSRSSLFEDDSEGVEERLESANQRLRGRIHAFGVNGGSNATFRDPSTARALRAEVKPLLALD